MLGHQSVRVLQGVVRLAPSLLVEGGYGLQSLVFSQHLSVLDETFLQLFAVKRAADDLEESRRPHRRAATVRTARALPLLVR